MSLGRQAAGSAHRAQLSRCLNSGEPVQALRVGAPCLCTLGMLLAAGCREARRGITAPEIEKSKLDYHDQSQM